MAINATLKVSVDQLKSLSNQFGTKATEVRTLTNNMLNLVNETKSVWHGEAQSAYVKKFDQLKDDMQRFYKKVDEYHTDLQEIAQNYTTAENANKAATNSLKTDVIK